MTDAVSHTVESTRRHALECVARGWAVFLLAADGEGGKVPPHNCPACDWRREPRPPRHDPATCGHLLCHGFHAATTDSARLDELLAALPTGHLAVRTGRASRLLVIDAEAHARPGEPTGLEVLDEWEAWTAGKAGSLPFTLRARSVSGGQHWYYRLPDGVPLIKSGRVAEGVDVKCEAGYVGAVGGDGRRVWLNPGTDVATAPVELIEWLTSTRRVGAGGGPGGGGAAPGYDFDVFLRDGCPDGHRDYFINDLCFRLRRRTPPLTLEELTERVWEAWSRVAQPPEARYEMPWEDVAYKIERVWAQVSPDATGRETLSWPGVLQPREDRITPSATHVVGGPPDLGTELSETGNAHRYARIFEGCVLYVPGVGWHHWGGNVYRYDELNEALRSTEEVLHELSREMETVVGDDDRVAALRRHRQSSSSIAARRAMLTGAATHPLLKTSVDSLNANPYLLVVPNGTIELRDRRHRPSDPSDLNTQVAGVLYDAEARCPAWQRHIARVTSYADGTPDPALAAFIQRWAGYTLTGLVSEQKFLFGFGGGANGKNVTVEVLLGILGDYGIRGSGKLLGDSREHETIIADLANTRMVFIDETPRGRVNEARLKELTGSSRIRARKIAQDSFEFTARFKLWIAGNNKPRVDETKEGFWRRLDLVPFDVHIPEGERVRDLAAVLLRDEGPGILNWCLEGLAAYVEGGLEPPLRVIDAGQSYRDEEDTTGQFIADTFEVNSPTRLWQPNRVIMHLYEEWCREQGIRRPLTMVQLGHDLGQHGAFTQSKKTRRVRWLWPNELGKSKPERGWVCPPPSVEAPLTLKWEGNAAPDLDDVGR